MVLATAVVVVFIWSMPHQDGCVLEAFPEEERVKIIATTINFISAQPAAIAALQSEFQVCAHLEQRCPASLPSPTLLIVR